MAQDTVRRKLIKSFVAQGAVRFSNMCVSLA